MVGPSSPEMTLPRVGKSSEETLRLKELNLEMRQLSIRENDFEIRKMEAETKRWIRLKELKLQNSSLSMASPDQSDFDINKCIRLVPPFNFVWKGC